MVKNFLLVAAIAASPLAVAANAQSTAVITDKDEVVTVAVAENTWAVVAVKSEKGLTKVREFHDMGDAGVQQIDYVANCSNGKLSMADFKVLTSMTKPTAQNMDRGYANLSFYQPVIQHDINIFKNACGDKVAMTKASAIN